MKQKRLPPGEKPYFPLGTDKEAAGFLSTVARRYVRERANENDVRLAFREFEQAVERNRAVGV